MEYLLFGSGGICGFAVGNAARAYRSSKLSEFERYLVFVRSKSTNTSALLIFVDTVQKRLGVGARLLFHANNKPLKNKNSWDIENAGGGLLRIEVPIGSFSEMVLKGGIGYEWNVNKTNYPPAKWALRDAIAKGLDPGAWRLELPLNANIETSVSVTVMTITEKKDKDKLQQSFSQEFPWGVAVIAGGDVILIPNTNNTMPNSIRLPGLVYSSVNRMLIAANKSTLANFNSILIGSSSKLFDGKLFYCGDETYALKTLAN